MNFKQSVKLLRKISQKELFYDVYKQVSNYEEPSKIKTPSSVIEKLVSSYRKEFRNNLYNFIKKSNIKEDLQYLIIALAPYYNEKLRYIVTRDDFQKFINKENLRINQILDEIKQLNNGQALINLQPLIVNYLNKINSLIELESKPSSAVFLPKGTDYLENIFDINLRKAFDLLGKVQLKYKDLNITEYKELNLERNKISLIKNKGFDENNELPGIIKYLEMLYKELHNQS